MCMLNVRQAKVKAGTFLSMISEPSPSLPLNPLVTLYTTITHHHLHNVTTTISPCHLPLSLITTITFTTIKSTCNLYRPHSYVRITDHSLILQTSSLTTTSTNIANTSGTPMSHHPYSIPSLHNLHSYAQDN